MNRASSEKIDMLGMKVDNLTRDEALEQVEACVMRKEPCYVIWVNLNQIVLYHENERFRRIVDHARLVLTDGQPVMWISKLLRTPIKEKLGGTDFMLSVCEMAAQKGYSIFLLGGAPGMEAAASEKLCGAYPKLRIAGKYSPPFGFEKNQSELDKINDMIRESYADILFVGVGSPKQDYFIEENMKSYGAALTFPTGSAIDIIGGRVKRAPRWMTRCGLEWFFRFCQEPRRLFRRYFVESWKILKYVVTAMKTHR